jgi:hypothetical protein
MKRGQLIRLEKLAAVPGAERATPSADNFIPGQNNGNVSLPVAYTVDGILNYNIEKDHQLSLTRLKRNGVESLGVTITSPITLIENDLLYTENSIYRLTVLGVD